VESLWRLLRFYLRRELENLMRNDVRLTAIGRLDALPSPARKELEAVIAKTSATRGLRLNLAINYGGRAELVDAMNGLLEKARLRGKTDRLEVTEELIGDHLYTAGLKDPDLLIRTSGEMRV